MTGSTTRGRFDLRLCAFAVLIGPCLIIFLGFLLIRMLGAPSGELALALVRNADAEAAGRLKMLAAWLALLVLGLTCIGYFLLNLASFTRRTAGWLIAAFLGIGLFGSLAMALGEGEGPWLMGERAICSALAPGSGIIVHRANAKSETGIYQFAARQPVARIGPLELLPRPSCFRGGMKMLWWLNFVQRILLAWVSPALVLGTIACLARPRPWTPTLRKRLNQRLQIHLYAAASIFVVGLLFLSAMLHWPEFAFRGAAAAAYRSHVDSFVFYWGVTYTLFIASYYVPVALLMARAGHGKSGGGQAATELLGLAKTTAALFAPALAGLLGSVLDL